VVVWGGGGGRRGGGADVFAQSPSWGEGRGAIAKLLLLGDEGVGWGGSVL